MRVWEEVCVIQGEEKTFMSNVCANSSGRRLLCIRILEIRLLFKFTHRNARILNIYGDIYPLSVHDEGEGRVRRRQHHKAIGNDLLNAINGSKSSKSA